MRALKSILHSSRAEYVVFALATGVAIAAAFIMSRTTVVIAPPARDYNSYTCANPHSSAAATFKILDPFRLNTNELADRLCADAVFAAHYGSVEVVWMMRDRLDLRGIVDQSYQLVLAKPELLKRVAATDSGYVPLARYQEYASEFIAIDTMPVLTIEYFSNKRLGLVDDPNSISGYQVPKAALQQAQIDEPALQVVLYKSHVELHRALFAKEVEVIASYSAEYFGDERATQRLALQEGLPGLQWYLHPALRDTPVHCQLYKDLVRYPASVGLPMSVDKPVECTDAR